MAPRETPYLTKVPNQIMRPNLHILTHLWTHRPLRPWWNANTMAMLGNNRHIGFGFGVGDKSSQGNNQGSPRTCTYKDFINCKPKTFFRTKGVTRLTRWIEKTESIFEINSFPEECKVKFVACTLTDTTMFWWNSYVKMMGLANANALSWEQLKNSYRGILSSGGNAVTGARVMEPSHDQFWHLNLHE